jgi:hypothetical protein
MRWQRSREADVHQLVAAVVLDSSCAGSTRASIEKRRFIEGKDCRVISAFTRVFRRAMPGNDGVAIARLVL